MNGLGNEKINGLHQRVPRLVFLWRDLFRYVNFHFGSEEGCHRATARALLGMRRVPRSASGGYGNEPDRLSSCNEEVLWRMR